MKYYVSKSAVCPFYQQEEREKRKIRCEGYARGVSTHVVFGGGNPFISHKRKFCYSETGYKKCPYYAVAAKQYEEERK